MCSVKKVILKVFPNSKKDTYKTDLKPNLKINLKIDFRTVVLFCESSKIFKNLYFVEHQGMATCAIDIDTIYSNPGQ